MLIMESQHLVQAMVAIDVNKMYDCTSTFSINFLRLY
jgi:hypothetical protein